MIDEGMGAASRQLSPRTRLPGCKSTDSSYRRNLPGRAGERFEQLLLIDGLEQTWMSAVTLGIPSEAQFSFRKHAGNALGVY